MNPPTKMALYVRDEPACKDVTAVIAEDEQLRRQAAGQPIGKPPASKPDSPVAIVTAVKTFPGDHSSTAYYADVQWIRSDKPVQLGAELYLHPPKPAAYAMAGRPCVAEVVAMYEQLTPEERVAFLRHTQYTQ